MYFRGFGTYFRDFDIYIKMLPDMYDIISGKVKTSTIFGTALIEIEHDLMPTWHWFLKRVFDVSVSLFVIIILSPLFLISALLVKFSSSGEVQGCSCQCSYRCPGR